MCRGAINYRMLCFVGHGEEDTEGLSVAISALSEKTITAAIRNLYKVASTQSKLVSMQ
jgi:hypothetical protein